MKKYTILFLMLVLNGCAVVEPLVTQFNIVSVPQEIEIGQQAAQQLKQQKAFITDDRLSRVQTIGQRLVQALPQKDFNYQFFVVEDESPNAFTIPGGLMYVHTGLLKFASNDDELAGVMAHEIGHAYLRHPAKSISRQYGAEYLSKLLFKENQSKLKSAAFSIAAGSILTRYGRAEELQADEVGFTLTKRAGYNPSGLIAFFTKLQNLEKGGYAIPFLSSHPPTPERIARLQAFERAGGNTSYINYSTATNTTQFATRRT